MGFFSKKRSGFLEFTRFYQQIPPARNANPTESDMDVSGTWEAEGDGYLTENSVRQNPQPSANLQPAVAEAHLQITSQFAPSPVPHKELQNTFASSEGWGTTRLWRGGEHGHLAEFSHGVQHTESQFIRSSVNPSVAYLLAKSNPTPYVQAKSAGTVFSSHSNPNALLNSSAADASLLGSAKLLGLSLNDSRPLVLVNRSEAAHLNGISDNPENLFRAFFQTIRTLPFSQQAIASKASGLAGASSQPQFFAGVAESLGRFFALPPAEQENLFAGFKNYFQNGNLSLLGFVQNVNSSGVQGLLQGVGHLLDNLFGTRFVQTFPQFWPMLGLLLIQTNLLPQNALNAALLAELSALMARRREKTKERKAPKLKRADRVAGKEQALNTDNYPDEDEAIDLFEAWFDEEDNSEALSFMWH